MKIEGIVWLSQIVDKLISKHSVEIYEVEEVLAGNARFRFVEKGERKGEDVYAAYGKTDSGRFMLVLFVYKKTLIISARDMTDTERRLYERK